VLEGLFESSRRGKNPETKYSYCPQMKGRKVAKGRKCQPPGCGSGTLHRRKKQNGKRGNDLGLTCIKSDSKRGRLKGQCNASSSRKGGQEGLKLQSLTGGKKVSWRENRGSDRKELIKMYRLEEPLRHRPFETSEKKSPYVNSLCSLPGGVS